jgi:hypothetical protein
MLGIFLFATVSRMALGPTLPPIQWVPGDLSLGVKWPGHEADHSPPSSAKVKECVELYLHSPNTPSWRDAQLKKWHRDNFTFTFIKNNYVSTRHCYICHSFSLCAVVKSSLCTGYLIFCIMFMALLDSSLHHNTSAFSVTPLQQNDIFHCVILHDPTTSC